MRFRHLIKRNRFLDALALCDPVDPVHRPRSPLRALTAWVATAPPPRARASRVRRASSWPSPWSVGRAGRPRARRHLARERARRSAGGSSPRRGRPRHRAPNDLASALRLAARAPGETALKAALLLADGREAEARPPTPRRRPRWRAGASRRLPAAGEPRARARGKARAPQRLPRPARPVAAGARRSGASPVGDEPARRPACGERRGAARHGDHAGLPQRRTGSRRRSAPSSRRPIATSRSSSWTDASDDGTADVARAVAARDPRVRVPRHGAQWRPLRGPQPRPSPRPAATSSRCRIRTIAAHPEKIARQAAPLAAERAACC